MEGERFGGKYQVIRLLGQGGMGAVYEAENVETGERVALKCISERLVLQGKDSLGRFAREAKAMQKIRTEHVVRVLDARTDPESKVPYMVMELLNGEDLERLLNRVERLEPDTALRLAAQVCLGLQKAHEAGVVHRDIKPANIFLARRGEGEVVVKILDFGIAKLKPEPDQSGATTGLTGTGMLVGSLPYMSPEQARGRRNIDFGTDIWSLGMVLYRALAGKLPHGDITAVGELIMTICSQAPPSIQEHAPWVEPEVATVVHDALRLDTAQRFPTAAAMLDAILPLLPGGFGLRDELLAPLSPATRERIAAKRPLDPSEGGAHQRLARDVERAGAGNADEIDTVEASVTALGPTIRALPTPTAASSIGTSTSGEHEASPQATDTSAPRARRRWKASAAAALVAAAGVGTFSLARSWRNDESSRAGALAASTIGAVMLPPAPPEPLAPPASTPLPDVSVELDRRPPELQGGGAEVEETPWIKPAPSSPAAPRPRAKAPSVTKAPPGTKTTRAPEPTAPPTPPATGAPEDVIPKVFR